MNRAQTLGHSFRISKTYGNSPLGIKALCRLERAVGGRSVLELMLPKCEGLRPFDNVRGERIRVRRVFSAYERHCRELNARAERGERFVALVSRQAV